MTVLGLLLITMLESLIGVAGMILMGLGLMMGYTNLIFGLGLFILGLAILVGTVILMDYFSKNKFKQQNTI